MFELIFLGTAGTTPSSERGLPALLVSAGSERFLIDCGEGTQRQLLRSGAGFRRLGHILLTHTHLDHVLGLGGLLSTLGLFDLLGDIAIHGSRETIGFVARYLGGIWPGGRTPVPVRLVTLEPGSVFAGRGYRVTCFPVRHHKTQSLGYLFETTPRRHLQAERLAALGIPSGPLRALLAAGEPVVLTDGRRIMPEEVTATEATATKLAIVGDTEETDTLMPFVQGADALVIEATFLDEDAGLALTRGHLTAGQAARLARDAGIGTLWLTHISGRYDPGAIAAEAARFFPEMRVMNDFDRVAVAARSHKGEE
ncbi:MAG: MBL fold metallo-hydrolase [Alphaproteobacteria bacterium]